MLPDAYVSKLIFQSLFGANVSLLLLISSTESLAPPWTTNSHTNSYPTNLPLMLISMSLDVSAMLKPLTPNHDKFFPRAIKCIFLGYPHDHKAYRVYDLHTRRIFICRDVTFVEFEFPFQHHSHATPLSPLIPIPLPELPIPTSHPATLTSHTPAIPSPTTDLSPIIQPPLSRPKHTLTYPQYLNDYIYPLLPHDSN